MPANPNKFSQFWQELKRRRVIKVITMYVATAFIIMEAADIMLPRLGLPDWTVTFIIILLIVGFPLTIILAWIFDITPEGIKKTEPALMAEKKEPIPEPVKRSMKISDGVIVLLLVAVCILMYPKIFKKDQFEEIRDPDGRISIAVMPFENQTGDTTLNWFQRGMSSLIINGLGSSTELAVRDEQSMYEVMESFDQIITAGLSPARSVEVAEKAHAETFVSGSFQGRDGNYLILANLVNTKNGDIIWTHKVEGNLKSSAYLDLANLLCIEIRNYLEIKALKQEADYDFQEAFPESAEAYRYYIEGVNLILENARDPAVTSLKKAYEIDSSFTFAAFFLAYASAMIVPQQWEQALFWMQKAYETRDNLPVNYQYWLELWYACIISENRADIIRYCDFLEESGLNTRIFWYDLGTTYYSFLKQYDKAIMAFEKVEEINKERDGPWEYAKFYQTYGDALHMAGKYEKEKEIHDLSLLLFTDKISKSEIFWRQAVWALTQKDTIQGEEFLDKYITVKKEIGETENIEFYKGCAYEESNMPSEGIIHFKNAIKQNPQNVNYVIKLARLLIYEDIDLNEGIELIEELGDSVPDNQYFLTAKGWGYYKLGRYNEALQYLKRVEELRINIREAEDLQQQIQEVEQALAEQNSQRP